jgi:hypothetical protein
MLYVLFVYYKSAQRFTMTQANTFSTLQLLNSPSKSKFAGGTARGKFVRYLQEVLLLCILASACWAKRDQRNFWNFLQLLAFENIHLFQEYLISDFFNKLVHISLL